MDLYEFAVNYPHLDQMIDREIESVIAENQMTGEEPIHHLDYYVEQIVSKYEQQAPTVTYAEMPEVHQTDYGWGGRGRDWDRHGGRRRDYEWDRHRRPHHDGRRRSEFRDLIRVKFLRRLFDGRCC